MNEDWERVTPSDLLDYRVTHLLKAPCCLCPLKMGTDQYIESAIFIARRGRLQGEYIACCATDECGYLGESHLHISGPKRGLTVSGIGSCLRKDLQPTGSACQNLSTKRCVKSRPLLLVCSSLLMSCCRRCGHCPCARHSATRSRLRRRP